MRKWISLLLATALTAAVAVACASSSDTAGGDGAADGNSVLNTVLDRGSVICGVNGQLPGFSFVDSGGEYSGMDADYCRAIAAALFDDPSKVEFRNLSAQERFTALAAGEVDVLIRNTTWTINRDTALGLEFMPTTFYDGQGMLVTTASGVKDLKGLSGKSICVQSGTTTEQNLTDSFRKQNIPFTPVVFDDEDALYSAFTQGRCQAATSDRSQLTARRKSLPNPDNYAVLDDVISKEPLGAAVRNNDSKWADAVKWITYSTFQAEELDITQASLAQAESSADPEVKRLLGKEGTLGTDMGLPNDFAARVIKAVGNYGEIYDRNIGTPFALERGLNELWTDGGLIYSPPFR
ncbi:MAG: amino acid ABC transporter substrate-binding protein [Pegethrix bostrychoides GSE-TBD4-15B]|jgi:general L-amino acid transport system substrate-binding protein|uniref:Amino acid ABC transporter substrate-binding protein n=1 Tax=Pegethrix bostrychoides GSE-TBD4-15B TaxID=2839662 RepID=A0A951PBL6_9CYAN|nr:amino acid ABC transporter substrate-binding protein [Pegethrix bostrychoides GSE-TBD4-15B]